MQLNYVLKREPASDDMAAAETPSGDIILPVSRGQLGAGPLSQAGPRDTKVDYRVSD